MYIYLDESGCLGFDFDKKGTSKYFIVTLLVIYTEKDKKKLEKGVERTIKNKVKKGRKTKKEKTNVELKGASTTIQVKKYFWKQIKKINFRIYALVLNKKRVFSYLRADKNRLYNFVSHILLDNVPFSVEKSEICIIIDRSKNKAEREKFNNYLLVQLKGKIEPAVLLNIFQSKSNDIKGLQAVDMFSWGIFRKHERKDYKWYDIFQRHIFFETKYLP